MYPTTDTHHHANLATLADALQDQKTRAIDVVAPASTIRAELGALTITGIDPILDHDGVTDLNGSSYQPTRIAEDGLADRLSIPGAYLRRCREELTHLWDDNINGWLAHKPTAKYLLRLLTHRDGPNPDSSAGIVRAVLSDRYRCIDNFDVLLAMLAGLGEAGVHPVVDADLTDQRMIVRVSAPQIRALAPTLLANYRNPWTGNPIQAAGWTPQRMAEHNQALAASGVQPGSPDPVVFAGFVMTNSETGGSRFTITPRLTVQVCLNGMTINADALSKVHIGGRLDEGVIRWSDDTLRKNLDLVTAQTRDAVAAFLTPEYVAEKVAQVEALAGAPVDDPARVVKSVSTSLGFSDAAAEAILGMFIRGGQMTAGGVMQAVTATAQTLGDADAAFEMELAGLRALEMAAAAAR